MSKFFLNDPLKKQDFGQEPRNFVELEEAYLFNWNVVDDYLSY